MRTMKWWMGITTLALVAACGGGGDPGTSVFDGGGGTQPAAADLTIVLKDQSGNPISTLPNTGTQSVTAEVTAVDANRNALAGIPITIGVDANAVATVSGTATNDQGVVTANIGIGTDRSNRAITVTATSGQVTRSISFLVTGAELTVRQSQPVVTPSTNASIEFVLVDANDIGMPGQNIVVTGPGGVQTQGITQVGGVYVYQYTAPNTTGPLDIRASAGGAEAVASVQVQAGAGAIPPVTQIVRSASVSANPSVVPVNSGSTTNRSEVRAIFLSDNNAPVRNVRVRFDLDGDLGSIGGSFSSGDAIVYSDANGVAAAAYIPGNRASPQDGVTVRACWDYDDFPAGTCPNESTMPTETTLTVVSEALSISIGTNALIEVGPTGLDYVKKYLVQVVDASGQAKSDVQISASVDLLRYYKGEWFPGLEDWFQTVRATCDNEDLNRNGNSETYSNGAVEDANGSFNLTPGRPALEPRKADISISFVGSSRTNSSGQVVIQLTYPQSVASWVQFNLVVSAAGVAGSEGRANFQGVLEVLAAEVADEDSDVPFRLSPYGIETSPVASTTNPAGQSGLLCTNPN